MAADEKTKGQGADVGEVIEGTPRKYLTALLKLPIDIILERVATIRTDIKNFEKSRKREWKGAILLG